ncbi:PKD domain-containing protein [Streptomyces sp. NPDC006463]|uniref:PKD domain-containing protein n=1 Tax=Streptomyces sp. NPDC006463 TaxID=3364746 RepID=UPI0036924E25
MAHAADPVKPGAHGVSAPAGDLRKATASKATTFTSPADRTVRQTIPAAGSKAAAAPTVATAGNPTLAVGLKATGPTAHAVRLTSTVTSAAASLAVTIAWGDGKTDTTTAQGAGDLVNEHTYAEVGSYKVTVTVVDAANNTQAVNQLDVVTEGSDFTPYGPTRLLDTRSGIGAPKGKVPAYGKARVKVGGNGGIPAGVTAVVLNVTVTNATSAGHVTAYPSGGVQPISSNVNFVAGQTVPNLVIVPVGQDGYVELYNGGWESLDLLADVTGYFSHTAASGYNPLAPVRAVDTRNGTGTAQGQLAGQGTFSVQMAGRNGVWKGISAVALNVTVTNPKEAGHLTVFPSGQAAPSTSSVNFTAGQTVANSVIVPVGPDGQISVRNGAWAGTDVIVDVVGFYTNESSGAFVPMDPARMLDTRDAANWGDGPLAARGYIYMRPFRNPAGVTGFVFNTTVTNTRGDGFLSVTPDPNTWDAYGNGTAEWPELPTASALNWTAGKTVPNLVQASAGANGIVDFWNMGWDDADLIVDIFGFYDTI